MFISCCARRSRVEQLLSILALVFTIQIGLVSTVLGTSERGNVCVTPGCVEAAARVRADMDQNVEPCVNFYDFACGGFVHNAIAEDQHNIGRISLLSKDIDSQLYDILAQPVRETEAPPMREVKRFFGSCMNLTQIERIGLQPLSDRMESMGGWPTLKGDTWNETDWTWQQAIGAIRELALGPDNILGSRMINGYWILYQPSLGISRAYLIQGCDENVVRGYYAYMVEAAVLFGANRQRSELDMREVLDFEIALANITIPSEEFRNFSEKYQHFILQEADKRFPFVGGFRKYFKELSPDSDVDTVLISSSKFFEYLGQLLARTPKRTIANYLFWRIIYTFSEYLNYSMRSLKTDFQQLMFGIADPKSRGIECVQVLKQLYPKTTESLYVRSQFNASTVPAVKEILEQIHKQSIHTIKNAKWMDQKARITAIKKLTAMQFRIGSSIEQLLDTNEYEYNQHMLIDDEYYFESVLSISRLNPSKTSNNANMFASYNRIQNIVTVSAGFLHRILFTIDRPRYMNFGSVGSVIGHEIMHGFDDHGIQLDDNTDPVRWLKPETRTTYLEKNQCIIDQYGNYTETQTGLKLNGINTQGDNFADNAGFKLTYEAYQVWVRDHQPEQALPGLPYTQNQLFWIAQAQLWCEHNQPEKFKYQIFDDEHSPAVFRVLGTLQNIPAFADDFNCPISSPMNPFKKCVIF